MKTFNVEKFRADLINLRNKNTQETFANDLGINRSTLSLIESGKQVPSLDILSKVCDLGSFNANDYFTEIDNDGLIYLMGTLEDNDKEKINTMMENIRIKDKYAMLSKRCVI